MKKIFILMLCLPLTLSAQLIDYGTYMRTDDQLTIGTSNDAYPLYVRKDDSGWQGRFTNRAGVGADIYMAHGAGYGMHIKGRTTGGQYTLRLSNLSGVTNNFYNNGNVGLGLRGNVGIGTTAPIRKLHVQVTGRDGLRLQGNNGGDLVFELNNGGGIHYIFDDDDNGHALDIESANDLVFNTNGPSEKMRIKENGNVGIGTSNPTYKLSVNGNIRAKEVRVETGWSDYVFYGDYQLPTLEEEEQHIEEKGHLLGFESEADMGGEVLLGDVSKRQQAKIEEIMLHLIEMNKSLKTNITELQKQIENLQAEVTELKK